MVLKVSDYLAVVEFSGSGRMDGCAMTNRTGVLRLGIRLTISNSRPVSRQ
jgi:hypothetical protein